MIEVLQLIEFHSLRIEGNDFFGIHLPFFRTKIGFRKLALFLGLFDIPTPAIGADGLAVIARFETPIAFFDPVKRIDIPFEVGLQIGGIGEMVQSGEDSFID